MAKKNKTLSKQYSETESPDSLPDKENLELQESDHGKRKRKEPKAFWITNGTTPQELESDETEKLSKSQKKRVGKDERDSDDDILSGKISKKRDSKKAKVSGTKSTKSSVVEADAQKSQKEEAAVVIQDNHQDENETMDDSCASVSKETGSTKTSKAEAQTTSSSNVPSSTKTTQISSLKKENADLLQQIRHLQKDNTDLNKKLQFEVKKYSSLKESYEELKEVGINKAAKTFSDFKASVETRFEAYEKLNAGVRSEMTHLEDKLRKSEAAHDAVRGKYEKLLGAYQILQGSEEKIMALQQDIESWKTLSDDLRKELTESREKVEVTQKINSEIKKELEKAREEAAKKRNPEVAASSEERSPKDAKYIQCLESSLQLYEELTGLGIRRAIRTKHVMEQDGKKISLPVYNFHCEHQGLSEKLKYELTVPVNFDNSHDFSYKPSSESKNEELPEFLSAEIEFEKSMASRFFWNVMNHLFPEEEDSVDEQQDAA